MILFRYHEIKKAGSNMELLFNEIYHSVFLNIVKGNVDVFLCGGASTKKKSSYRDMLKDELKRYKRISILYPALIFSAAPPGDVWNSAFSRSLFPP